MIDANAIVIAPVPGCEVCDYHIACGVREACSECRADALEDLGIRTP